MSEFTIANELARITLLSPIEFEKELLGFIESPHLLRLLADLLASNKLDTQKQLAASGINYLITHRLNHDYNQWKQIWPDFLDYLLHNQNIDMIEWRFLMITGKGLGKLMEEFQENFCHIINPIFRDLPYMSKALIYDTFLYVESTPQTKYVFIRETIEDFLAHTLDTICRYHDSHKYCKDTAKLEYSVAHSLASLLKSLTSYSQGNIYDMTVKISQNVDIFLIIVEVLLFNPDNKQHESVLKKDFAPERMSELLLSCEGNAEINKLKATIFKICITLLCQYDLKSGIEEFDQHKLLFFMENLTPIVFDRLIKLAQDRRKHVEFQEIIISMIYFLERSCKFNFMLQTFENNFQKIFYSICLPFLETTEEEKELYENQYQQFIRISEQLYQGCDNQEESTKNSTGKFCESLSHIMHGSLLFIVQNSIQTIRSILLKEQSQKVREAIQLFGFRPSVDTSLILLSLFSSEYSQRRDMYELIKNELLSIPQLLEVRGIDKARLIIFLAYNYENIFKDEPKQGTKFLLFADEELNHKNCNSECSLMLFQNCLELGFGDDIWQNFIMRIQSTNIINIFHLLNTILKQMLSNLPVQKVQELISRVISRLVSEFRKCEEQCKNRNSIQGNQFLYICLDIISTIVNDQKYLKQEESVIPFIWPIFDLFEFAERIEFQDNILEIFNQILAVEKHLDHKHYLFISAFEKIYQKHNGFVDLIDTIIFLLTKSRDYLLTEEQGKHDLLKLMQFIKCTYSVMKNEGTLRYILVFFHYIYYQYSSVVPFDEPFYVKLMEIYQDQKDMLNDETKAAIINFLLICKYEFGCCDLSIIDQNRIQMFKGYQAKLFIFGLRKLIEKGYQSDYLLKYLQYSIRLAHFVRQTNLKQQPQRHGYYEPNFPDLCKIDPFAEISLSLNFVKQTIEPRRYDAILQQLNREIELGDIKDLLSRRIVNNSIRSIKKPVIR